MTAYIIFEPKTLLIQRVSWKKPDNYFVEIADDLAEQFITGHKIFINYKISLDSGSAVLIDKKNDEPNFMLFSKLRMVDSTKSVNSEIVVKNNVVVLFNLLSVDKTLFITRKNDPTWLIKTIDITTIASNDDGSKTIQLPQADSYSYFLGR